MYKIKYHICTRKNTIYVHDLIIEEITELTNMKNFNPSFLHNVETLFSFTFSFSILSENIYKY